jgi:peptide/nickel transport system permease protein
MEQWWNNWHVQNAIVAVLLIGAIRTVWVLRRQPYWRAAARELAKRRMAMVSLAVLMMYAAIALLDSVGGHPPLRDADGAMLRSPEGEVLRDPVGRSWLDALARPMRERREKTYSAPFATHQFTPEFVPDAEGRLQQVYPPLHFPGRHPLGTDKVGEDVLYQALKGVRTGIILGLVTTLMIIPFAIFFGVVAGYFGGATDDAIQYLYTVLASVPPVLLIAAFIMIFGRGLPQLVIIMGVTSWTGLCRVLRGETLKLREMEYVQSAEALGQSPVRIIRRHIVPNLMHLVVITLVLGFSGRVLSEAALTYVGVGVGAETYSWGRMINDARMELARDPVVWWKLAAAFVAMFGIVLPANIFGDAVRDALDPRLRTR